MKFLYILAVVFLFSCSKENEKQVCGQESIAEFTIHNYSEFAKFQNRIIVDEAEYYSHYKFKSLETVLPGNFLWGIQVKLNNICKLNKPKIELLVSLHHPDSLIIPEATIWEGPTFVLIKPLSSKDDFFYHDIHEYNFQHDYTDKTGSLIVTIFFPMVTSGSFSADSAYFFSNLDYMSCKITAHKP